MEDQWGGNGGGEGFQVCKRMLGASTSVAGAAVRGDLGWRKLEERRK